MKAITKAIEKVATKSTEACYYFYLHQTKAPKCLIKK